MQPTESKPLDKPENIIETSTYKLAEYSRIYKQFKMYHTSKKRLFVGKSIFFFQLLVKVKMLYR